MTATTSEQLCLVCGLCCNGVLFKDVELQPDDDATQLAALGLPLKSQRKKTLFPQPCHALDGCTCRIYASRPARCRQFNCALLSTVGAGKLQVPAALRVIREARQRADKVRELLRRLGDNEESLALSLRFQRLQKKSGRVAFDENAGDSFGELTLAVHSLNLILREKFYPDPAD